MEGFGSVVLLLAARSSGFTLDDRDGSLVVSPRPEEYLRGLLAGYKDGLLALLAEERHERLQAILNDYEPNFDYGPVQMVELAAVMVFDRVVVVEAERHRKMCQAFANWNAMVYEQGKKKRKREGVES